MVFRDRIDAGRRLGEALQGYAGKDVVVLALPRGGVPVAAEVARALNAPLDLLLVRKIGVPRQPEIAMGAIVDGDPPIVVRNEEVIAAANIPPGDFERVRRHESEELERRRRRYVAGRERISPGGRIAIVVDDGIATGSTMKAAVRGLKQQKPAEIVIAVPVAAPEAVADLRREADAVVSLEMPRNFRAIGAYFEDFGQLEDDEVARLLERGERL
ncbi:phosphoribosyltransferase family protein [Breoghania sp. JC706]|uniref:phosphoribosyltransferase n=1 Tax=Breoghania sp. JC706 TaxID=3117732 RepID=UPI00300AD29A